jgi:hypothetical protein
VSTGATPERLGAVLLERGHVTEAQLAEAEERRGERDIPLGQLLVEMGVLTRLQLAGLLTEQWAPTASAPSAPAPAPAVAPAASPPPSEPQPRPEVFPIDLRERLTAVDRRLDQLEQALGALTARLDSQPEPASRDAVEDLRLALRELWKVQKNLLERDGAAA